MTQWLHSKPYSLILLVIILTVDYTHRVFSTWQLCTSGTVRSRGCISAAESLVIWMRICLFLAKLSEWYFCSKYCIRFWTDLAQQRIWKWVADHLAKDSNSLMLQLLAFALICLSSRTLAVANSQGMLTHSKLAQIGSALTLSPCCIAQECHETAPVWWWHLTWIIQDPSLQTTGFCLGNQRGTFRLEDHRT